MVIENRIFLTPYRSSIEVPKPLGTSEQWHTSQFL
jgi:hypothetical protein